MPKVGGEIREFAASIFKLAEIDERLSDIRSRRAAMVHFTADPSLPLLPGQEAESRPDGLPTCRFFRERCVYVGPAAKLG